MYASFKKNVLSQVEFHHLETFFIGSATGEIIFGKLLEALEIADLPVTKLLSLGMDGPNVNKNVRRRINEHLIKLRGKGLLNIGECNLHVISNTFHKGLLQYGSDVADLIVQTYNWFDGFASRLETFKNFCSDKKYVYKPIVKHVPSRWLSLGPAAERFLEMYDPLKHFFVKHLPAQKSFKPSKHHTNILNYFKKEFLDLEIQLVIESANLFTPFLTIFQSTDPMIHLLFTKILGLIKLLASKICVDLNADVEMLFNEKNIKNNSSIVLSNNLDELIKKGKLIELDKQRFLQNYKRHYLEAGKYLISKILNNFTSLEAFQCLDPKKICEPTSLQFLKNIMKQLSLSATMENQITDEFKLLQFEKLSNVEYSRIDEFWIHIFKNYDYKNLEFFIKSIISTSHGQADVERRFSLSGNILQVNNTNMTVRTMNARLNAVDGVQRYGHCIETIPITKSFLNLANNARKSYKDYLENEKMKNQKEIEAQNKLKEDEKTLRESEMRQSKIIQDLKSKLKTYETDLNNREKKLKDDQKLTDAMLVEASEKLEKCINKNDLIGAKIAQSLLTSANDNRKKEKTEKYEIDNLRKKRNAIFEKLSQNPNNSKK